MHASIVRSKIATSAFAKSLRMISESIGTRKPIRIKRLHVRKATVEVPMVVVLIDMDTTKAIMLGRRRKLVLSPNGRSGIAKAYIWSTAT